MRNHPIPPVTEPLQYRAIGIVRGQYKPDDLEQLTRGNLIDSNGLELEAVLLGRVLALMRRHIDQEKSHLWVVYPRFRETDHLHLQIAGVWEPSTLAHQMEEVPSDELPEGDDYFSIRGELIYTKPESQDIVIKIRQRVRPDGRRPLPFKLNLKGRIGSEKLRHFVSLDVRRKGNQLFLEDHLDIAPMPTRGGRKKGNNKTIVRRIDRKKVHE